MRTSVVSAALLAALATAANAQVSQSARSPYGYSTIHESRAVTPGQEARVWWAQMIDPDCSPHGTMTTQVVDAPKHGELRLSDDAFFPSFGPENPRAVCDTRKVAGKQAFYTARADFKGHDRVVLQNSTSEGRIRKIVVDIDVR